MKVTVIGYWGGYPNKDGATSCYLVEKDNYSLLLDVGSGALSKLQKYKRMTDIDAVLLSHYHHDHVADIGVLQYAKVIEFYVNGNDRVLPIYGHTEDQEGFQRLTHNYTKGVPYNPKAELDIGPFRISFLKTKHPVPCYGMRITDGQTDVVYTADTSYQESWINFSKDADLIMTDCNYYANLDGSKAGHMNSKDAATIAQKAQVKSLLLSHLPQFGDTQQLVEEASEFYNGPIHLAEEGKTFQF